MPVHDWVRVDAGTFHDFHQGRTIEIRNALNRGVLPSGYFALADQRVSGPEPDVIELKSREPLSPGGLGVSDSPPRSQQQTRVSVEGAVYARQANRISVRHQLGRVVALIEVLSPGNKDSKHAHVDSLAVVDALPDAPLFLAPEWYVNIPLEKTYSAAWDVTPQPVRDLLEAANS